MRKTVLLNSNVSSVISKMGHTDMLTVGDCGLPVPKNVERIDLALKLGMPRFLEVLDTILEELCVEKIILQKKSRQCRLRCTMRSCADFREILRWNMCRMRRLSRKLRSPEPWCARENARPTQISSFARA